MALTRALGVVFFSVFLVESSQSVFRSNRFEREQFYLTHYVN